jgi:prepilin-type N-terminal cleavage/methylation domain-containing protein
MRRAQRGFTLIEMMVVVAIIAILTSLAIVSMKPKTRPVDVAARFAGLVADASRVAVKGGPVRSDVALAEGTRRRSRIVGSITNGVVGFSVETLVEEANTPAPRWEQVIAMSMPRSVTAEDFAMAVGDHASVSLATDWLQFEMSCFPDGSCTAASLFFSSPEGATSDRHARVSVLPLGTATFIKNDWN